MAERLRKVGAAICAPPPPVVDRVGKHRVGESEKGGATGLVPRHDAVGGVVVDVQRDRRLAAHVEANDLHRAIGLYVE